MRIYLTFTLIIICAQSALAQQDKTLTEKSHSENIQEIAKSIFKYPEFTDGKVILKDNSEIAARLNYNRILGQFLFISRQGKTQTFEHPETFDKIIIGIDTFRFYNNGFLEKFTHYLNVNLYVKQTIRYIEKEKNVIAGTPIIVTSDSKLPYSNDDPTSQSIIIEKNAQFKFINEYFLVDKLMNVYPATKKGFYDLFPKNKNELKNYLHDHSVNFNNIDQMGKLLQYLSEL